MIEFEATERRANPVRTGPGGILWGIADAAMGLAYASTLEERERFARLELKMTFLKPPWRGRLIAIGCVVSRWGSVGLIECDVTDDGEELVARASSTRILPGRCG